MTILLPLLFWLPSTALRVAVVLCIVRVLQQSWLTDPLHLLLATLPFLIELTALLATPLPPSVFDKNDVRGKQLRRSYLATHADERRNNIHANTVYLLLPGIVVLFVDLTAIISMRSGLPDRTESTLLWAFAISAVLWLPTLLILKRFGPDYGPPPEPVHHTHSEPPPKQRDVSRTEGMDADAPGDVW